VVPNAIRNAFRPGSRYRHHGRRPKLVPARTGRQLDAFAFRFSRRKLHGKRRFCFPCSQPAVRAMQITRDVLPQRRHLPTTIGTGWAPSKRPSTGGRTLRVPWPSEFVPFGADRITRSLYYGNQVVNV
jgi:hypothetical protein